MQKFILLVDDDPDIARLVSGLLKSREYRVDVAATGAEALEKVFHRPDLILLDRTLPDMDGLDICRRVREDKRLRGIPIVILSGRDEIGDKVEGLYVGADDYITKPYDNEELIARLEAVLRRSRFAEQLFEEQEKLAVEIKRIIAEADLLTFFQPILSVSDLSPVGFEVLSRTSGGMIGNPELLFRAALNCGMYFELEMLCWEKAFAQWRHFTGGGKLFLNCMPYLIENESFGEEIFSEKGGREKDIVLEMTERMAIHDYALFHTKVGRLKKAGLQIAIDDVGNGYASLDAIAETEPDYVKIDMTLVRNIHTSPLKRSIIESITGFCCKNGIMSVAEGVEKTEEFKAVRDLGVGAVQGYLFSPPRREISAAVSFDPASLEDK